MTDLPRPHVVVIGAGVAGLSAARSLRGHGIDVTVIDRGQTIGGRLHTRHGPGDTLFDLGPQYLLGGDAGWRPAPFGARQLNNRQMLADLNMTAAANYFPIGEIGPSREPAPDAMPAPEFGGHAIRGGMVEIAFALLPPAPGEFDSSPYRGHTEVVKIEPHGRRWRVRTRHVVDQTLDAVTTDAVVVAIPVPLALALADASSVPLPQSTRDELRDVRYTRCFAVAAAFDGPSHLPPGGGVRIADSPLEWVTDNHRRQVSPSGPALTGLSSEAWATAHWDEPDDAVLTPLLQQLRAWADGVPRGVVLHRWEFARPVNPLDVACVVARQEPPLVFAGDGFAGHQSSHVVAAYTSGLRAATQVLGLFSAQQRRERRFKVASARRLALEVCVTSAEEAAVAAQMGADRVELCSALEVGGVTPSAHTFLAVRAACPLPVYVLLRPRTGGFTYSHDLFVTMVRDAEWFLANGAAGIVFGILTAEGRIDHERCRALVELAGNRAVFNREFDFVPDPLVAIEELIALGFERVQTSGRAATAEAGMGRIHGWIQHAGWQIEVMPAGGVHPATVAQLLAATGADQVHGSFRATYPDPTLSLNPGLAAAMGAAGARHLFTDAETVQAMRRELDAIAAARATGDGDGE